MYTLNHDAVMWLVFFGIILLKFYLQEQKLMFDNYKIKSCSGRFEELQNNAFLFSLSGTSLCSYKNISFLSLNFHRSSRARASQLIASFCPPLSCVTGLVSLFFLPGSWNRHLLHWGREKGSSCLMLAFQMKVGLIFDFEMVYL
jgi:hypothetical protein